MRRMRRAGDAELRGKNVLLYVDYNVEMESGRIVCSYKIESTYDTIEYLLRSGCRCLMLSTHLGRPRNREEYSVRPIYEFLHDRYETLECVDIASLIKPGVFQSVCRATDGLNFYLTDNIRYYGKDEISAYYGLFDCIVNDSFGSIHREPHFETAYAGFLMEREVEKMSAVGSSDLVIMGGSKASAKLPVLERFQNRVFVGGKLSQDIYRLLGYEMGIQPTAPDTGGFSLDSIRIRIGTRRAACALSQDEHLRDDAILLPMDYRVLNGTESEQNCQSKKYNEVQADDEIIDIGPESIQLLTELIGSSGRIFWNGPLGKFEDSRAASTRDLVRTLETVGQRVVCGGGETLAAVLKYSAIDKFKHVSTGGGAVLELLTDGHLPGLNTIDEDESLP